VKPLKTALLVFAVCAAGYLIWRGLPDAVPRHLVMPGTQPLAHQELLAAPADSGVEPSKADSAPRGNQPVAEPVSALSNATGASFAVIRGGEESDVPWTGRTPAAWRARTVFPDPALMAPVPALKVGDRITLALFDDAIFEAEISTVNCYPNGAVGMTAHLRGGDRGVVYLSCSEGVFAASIEVIGRRNFEIINRDGAYYAIEVDRAGSDIFEGDEAAVPDGVAELPGASVDTLTDAGSDLQDGVATIDILLVYSQAAASWAATNGGMGNIIAGVMQRANEAHNNSDTRVVFNLIHSEQVSYTESGDVSTDLAHLQNKTDGQMDSVHTLRDTYKADLVCLLLNLSNVGGFGYTLNDEAGKRDYGFCLARVQQSRDTYTVVHEWGHNMGCRHSKTQTDAPGPGLFSYSAGWQWDDAAAQSNQPYTQHGYCSVMTYEDVNNDGTQDYERVAYFSNPSISYVGAATNATGNAADGDNARTIRATRYAVAEYRGTPAPVTNFPYSNSFEYGFIDWSYDGGAAPWKREEGSDPNLIYAVTGGYSGTTNAADGRFFAFIDTATNSTAFLDGTFDFSQLFTANMTFSYYMNSSYTSLMGSLSLQVSTNGGASWLSLFTKSGNQGAGWKQTNVNLSAYAGLSNVKLRFRADTSSKWLYTYILLDSIYLDGIPNLDVDSDGIPNEWELQYFGGATNANPAATASNGVNTVMEAYIAGISPVDPTAFLKIANFKTPAVSGNSFVVEWSAVSGRVYGVHWATNLQSSFLALNTNIVWPQASYTDTLHSTESHNFYKITVRLAQ